MNNSTHYFDDAFASAAVLQIHLLLPIIIEKMCHGCRTVSSRQSDHIVCQMGEIFFFVCFQDALNLIDKKRAEQQFRSFIYPRPNFIYTKSWYESLWSNPDWMKLVEDKVVELRSGLMDL